ncbi:P2X receptors are ATP-gated ion channels that play a role in intracellular calcium signaling. Not required for the purinergic response to extracellular nucleotides [Seminavis robusta]|uniref:P2X receptors are ATP-gated ion channels that play a role in intracellular calcium signaling. Not required for the purinergic response to extracellular nucleotides n=1 Tax=Seminavis robusta TaxID=568900 RepID=A0A9N8E620_9STRA|nr:P2X receptors are ATP-gated ion channels that play a role in intracellular calcium signaling. Not required for the purinergic response to extracellular nucleotides [Seminavis robusta]|eukprot:Sro587_g171270.1 P2X receptors are ATP-gated ion channels that play a role in intracellular calcium signaling. Not required for the purinergic response to extracellular nucleotides (517) ;mRNA; r:6395-7945
MLCAYPTVKYVQIQDSRLVCLRYTLLLAIAFYVGFFEMFALGGWLDPSPVVGVVRFSLQQPTVDNCDPSLPGCDNAFSPVDTMPYCKQYYSRNNNKTEYKGHVYPCEIYEAASAQLINEKSLTVMTRASTTEQEFVCPASTTGSCPNTYNNTSPAYKFYVHQSESFTVLIDHAVTASKICTAHQQQQLTTDGTPHAVNYACSAESAAYQGRLYSKNQHLCQQEAKKQNAFYDYRSNFSTDTAPCYINPNRTQTSHQDFFSLNVLLQAAGVNSLDDCNINNDNGDNKCQTFRDTGATLLLNVFWSDFVNYRGVVEPHYYYSPQLVGTSSYKQFIPFYHGHYRSNRTLLNAHGIRVAVLLGGEFHMFHSVTFLVTLTTALGLLAVATTVVDSLMLYVLPEKDRYNQVKYDEAVIEADDAVSSTLRAGWGHLRQVNQNLMTMNNNHNNNNNFMGMSNNTFTEDGPQEPNNNAVMDPYLQQEDNDNNNQSLVDPLLPAGAAGTTFQMNERPTTDPSYSNE